MFEKLFGKKSEEKPEEPESKLILNEYLSAKKDIKYLEDKYDDFIIRSLQIEFEQYKQFVDSNYPRIGIRNHWMFTEIKSEEFTLKKKDGPNEISIVVDFDFWREKWELKSARVKVGWNSTGLDKDRINEIIFQYFIYWQLKEIEKQRDSKKESFQKMIDIIGKDVKRDALIDQILSDEKSTN